MNSNTSKYILALLIISFLIACSTKKDTFLARNSHALSTKLNILYNGQIALDKGVKGINDNTTENFWNRLPVEKMQITDDVPADGKSKNADFELAEAKATKAIQKHSMNIGGHEKNYQIDEAYLLLGKSRYYDQRFIPALDAFNYILYKYPNSSNIYDAKMWREKTNVRLGNEAVALKNISKLIKDNEYMKKEIKKQKLSRQEFANANAILASAFLNLEEKDSAVIKLKLANEYTKIHEEKERYSFLLGQLYEEAGQKDSAVYFYQTVIDMNRKAERRFVIQAYAKKAQLSDYKDADYDLFVKKSKKIMEDRENRPYLDVIYHSIGIFYDHHNEKELALDFYNASLEKKSADSYLNASNYRNIGNLYFKHTEYLSAAKNYDKSLELLDPKSREFLQISKIRKNLDEAIINETIAKRNDSIIYVYNLKEPEQVVFYENYIQKLKSSDELKKMLDEKQKQIDNNILLNGEVSKPDTAVPNQNMQTLNPPTDAPNTNPSAIANTFYFYNPNTVAYGKLEFRKIWGNRVQNSYWRFSSGANLGANAPVAATAAVTAPDDKLTAPVAVNEKYTTDYYLKQLPKSQKAIDSISKERNAVYYELGIIYKEKFKEYNLASNRLEQLLLYQPEEKLILPTKYNLYKIYEITNPAKAEAIKQELISQYPNSRYVQIITNSGSNEGAGIGTPEGEYDNLYRLYKQESFASVLQQVDGLISNFTGEAIVPKFELLKANTIGKLYGLAPYKKAMQYVADNYSNSKEGKEAIEILKTQIPLLEQMKFSTAESRNWKVVFKIDKYDNKAEAAIESKVILFFANENVEKLKYTCDSYSEKESFVSIQGIHSQSYAQFVAALFAENEKYKISQPGIIISNENYKIVQIKKNFDEYLSLKKL
ncbi:type IX secretion system periplasmic lipoprotein PorW/SprE [Flavobacterium aquicola]|uniref:Protein involved in gliding motility SprE n=1 Tax=Flavobacterium aquicola TaxID=1682742 RepID=A0A3E0EP73_9FLAO|nr:tetratricopeptide repeat protein [Flavobacterium aquicola]REG98946.1 protein involved in gliding motility SprE [Flavobacterium aquicola]